LYVGTVALQRDFFYFPKGDPGTTANESLRDACGIQTSNFKQIEY